MILTPAMKQFWDIKNKYPDCIILFRMGDFYETFYDDAKIVSRELEITLTARGKGESRAPLAGLPHHALEPYLVKLIKKGYKVAIVEQIEDPKTAKGIVKRAVARIVTPGTLMDSLDSSRNNYLMSVYPKFNEYGISIVDLSTGEFIVLKTNDLIQEIRKYNPKEILIPISMKVNKELLDEFKTFINYLPDSSFKETFAHKTITEHFKINNLNQLDLTDSLIISSAGALLEYLYETQKTNLNYINKIRFQHNSEFMKLDETTIRNLELFKNFKNEDNTLFKVLNKTKTPMGSRLLRKIIILPLMDIDKINKRLDGVYELFKKYPLRENLTKLLNDFHDIERIIARINYGNINPKELISLERSLNLIPKINELLKETKSSILNKKIEELDEIKKLINKSIEYEKDQIIADNYNNELDKIRDISLNAKKHIANLEKEERKKTGINSLKISYNKVFGYFIYVTKNNLHLVPDTYIRKQTITNGERYITSELKEKEELIITAQEKIKNLEEQLFQEIITIIAKKTKDIQEISSEVALIDILQSFASIAIKNNYCRPIFSENNIIELRSSRHPVIELLEEHYIPNDCVMNNELMKIITGPNMSGKSSYMRQIALIQLMSQIGSFVPAASAKLPICDRIFTRVGAHDDLTTGQSTFMVEMNETATILTNATKHSLIILDEIGRGTSTYDGISIAWAVAEYIYTKINAKTLFATHYHQMNKLEEKYKGIVNYNIAVKEDDDELIFLRKIKKGGTNKSFGIQVAKLAGLPKEVIENSKKIMTKFELNDRIGDKIHQDLKEKETTNNQKINLNNYI